MEPAQPAIPLETVHRLVARDNAALVAKIIEARQHINALREERRCAFCVQSIYYLLTFSSGFS
jgi:hypothetical protein